MENTLNNFSKNWSRIFNKKKSVYVNSGTKAVTEALKILQSKDVAIPTYTCERILKATLEAGCKPKIIDCNYDLQISKHSLEKFKGDTVIVPHMFGIKVDIEPIKSMGFNVIEDCSQGMGFSDIGKYSDVVVASTGGGCKWLSIGNRGETYGGGIVSYDEDVEVKWWKNYDFINESVSKSLNIEHNFNLRNDRATELINAGVDLIGRYIENAWMRGMYFTDNQKRVPYTPIHDLYGNFKCPLVDGYKNKLDWISINI